jgi:8-hydroxy-5-deazaflavin:NADPH oxidoreductase
MQIAMIGRGNVGQALGSALVRSGHQVTYGTRTPDGTKDTALPAIAAANADVVIIALPWKVAAQAVPALGNLSGRIVIDCMNPIAYGAEGIGPDHSVTGSGGQMVQGWLPGALVVKTLNQVGASVMAEADQFSQRPVQFIAGDDAAAKATVTSLLHDIGFTPLDAGGLAKSALLEAFALLWINQAMGRSKGRDWAFAITTKGGRA